MGKAAKEMRLGVDFGEFPLHMLKPFDVICIQGYENFWIFVKHCVYKVACIYDHVTKRTITPSS